jgi:hypothetical protein
MSSEDEQKENVFNFNTSNKQEVTMTSKTLQRIV